MPATWKGSLSFGLVSIPIQLSPAARTERISFNQLHKVCHTRLKQPLFCPTCNRMVERSEVEKGYEYEKDQYLLFSEEELENVEPESARIMEILEFVKVDEIDPLYFDASYYATPEQTGAKAYRLLHEAMLRTGYAGIAKVTMHSREYIVIVRPRKNGLTLHTMFYSNEIRPAAETGTDKFEVKEQERALATQLIESLAAPFDPEKYHDTYQESLRTLIEAKAAGQEVVAVHAAVQAPPVDLMAALKQSLMQKPQPRGEKKALLRVVPKTEQAAVEASAAQATKKSRRKVG
ncbi:MAG TPA: Ku protein [Candidatus Acidoferrum sp.]|nr:Ku protein [Candidatus Acidoferrum sp.]